MKLKVCFSMGKTVLFFKRKNEKLKNKATRQGFHQCTDTFVQQVFVFKYVCNDGYVRQVAYRNK